MADLISGKYLRKNEGKQHQKIKEENNNHSQFMSLDGNERKMYE